MMAELKERDRELNAMASSHHRQLHVWEQNRQRVLALEQRCARLDGEETETKDDYFESVLRFIFIVDSSSDILISQNPLWDLNNPYFISSKPKYITFSIIHKEKQQLLSFRDR